MGKRYGTAEVQANRRLTFQRCNAGAAYTAFNMGSGESCIIALLYLLQRMPRGGLLVVEEIEAGLHPQAQVRLAEVMIAVCLRKQIQVICSTHSSVFLDALPRQGRILIRRNPQGHEVYESPSTRFALSEMTGTIEPELQIHCEDRTAAILVEEALPLAVRKRVVIRVIGSDVTVIRQGVAHLRSGSPLKQLCILDGDCTEQQADEWINSEAGDNAAVRPNYLRLPGAGSAPEQWAVAQFDHEPYRNALAEELGCSPADAQGHAEAMHVDIDHHDIAHTLHQRTNLERADCLRRIMRSVAPQHPQLDQLRATIAVLLD
jgi:hypothetical protein